MNLEEVEKFLKQGTPIEEAVKNFDWKEFEGLVREIFESHDFKVKNNFRFKSEKRFEIDLLAINSKKVFCVDCKEWGKGRNKTSALKNAAEMQENRMNELEKFLKSNPVASKMLKIDGKQEFLSLIVTWLEEDLIRESGTVVVPVWKLNSFLANPENYY